MFNDKQLNCIAKIKEEYDKPENGLTILTHKWMLKHKIRLDRANLSLAIVAEELGVLEEFKQQSIKLRMQSRGWKLNIPQISNENQGLIQQPSQENVISSIKKAYELNGIKSINYKWLKEHLQITPHFLRTRFDLNINKIIASLNLEPEYNIYVAQSRLALGNQLWTEDHFQKTIQDILSNFNGSIPAVDILKSQGYSAFVTHVSKKGMGMDKLREEYHTNRNAAQVSRDGKMWMSMAEASAANFLWSRNINVIKGRRYPIEFQNKFNRIRSRYDMHFICTSKKYQGKEITIEIWGNSIYVTKKNVSHLVGPNGQDYEEYNKKRLEKEQFNKEQNILFLGISFQDCYDSKKLIEIFTPYVLNIDTVLRTSKPYDAISSPTSWSLIDKLIKVLKEIMTEHNMSNMPPYTWLSKTGIYEHRATGNWEQKISGYTLREWIQKCGGYSKIREIMQLSGRVFTKTEVITQLKNFYEVYKQTHSSVMGQWVLKSLDERTDSSVEDHEKIKLANKINCALRQHYPHEAYLAYEEANIPAKRFKKRRMTEKNEKHNNMLPITNLPVIDLSKRNKRIKV